MTYGPNLSEGNFLPETIFIPEDPEEFKLFIKNRLEEILRLLNRKDTGNYDLIELMTNQEYFGSNPQTKRGVFRKVINTGTLPNAALKQVAHGLTPTANWLFTRIYGFSFNGANRWIPMPNAGPNYQVELYVGPVNVNITTAVNLTAFTTSYVILEFVKN